MKKKRKIKIPAAAFGIQAGDTLGTKAGKAAGGIGDSMGGIAELASSFTGTSTAQTTGDVTKQSLMGVASGIGTGAKIGASIGGPWGAAIGAVGGAIVGGIGKKGKAAGMTSFTDYDEGTLSTGMRAIGSNSGLKRERRRVKINAYNNRAAVAGTENLANEYAEEYGDMDTNTFAYGGALPSSLAYVDDGELLQTPDGQVGQVPEQGQPTDSNLMNLPEGTRILSNTLKVPGTKKTFSELGESMMTKKKSKGTDRFASNASKLNEMNNKTIHDQLFSVQEQLKQVKGIKDKTKNLIPANQDGGYANLGRAVQSGSKRKSNVNLDDTFLGRGLNAVGNFISGLPTDQDIADGFQKYVLGTGLNTPEQKARASAIRSTVNSSNASKLVNQPFSYSEQPYVDAVTRASKPGYGKVPNMRKPISTTAATTQASVVQPTATAPTSKTVATPVQQSAKTRTVRKPAGSAAQKAITAPIASNTTGSKKSMPNLEMAPLNTGKFLRDNTFNVDNVNYIEPSAAVQSRPRGNTFDWKSGIVNGLTDLSTLAPIFSNMMAKNDAPVQANYNPYASAINRTMGGRRFNIDPAIADIGRNRATSNYNAGQMNTNTGANMAYRLQSALGENRAITDLRAQESNVNNQYAGEYANTMNSLGQQWVGATNLASDLNAQNRASTRNIRRTGASQLSQWAQNKKLMGNQESRDDAMMQLYAPFLQAGYSQTDLANLKKYLRKGGNNVG